jgi:MFS transporter, UMF1 family
VFVDIFGVPRAGMGGIAVVLVAGILAMLVVRVPSRRVAAVEQA